MIFIDTKTGYLSFFLSLAFHTEITVLI